MCGPAAGPGCIVAWTVDGGFARSGSPNVQTVDKLFKEPGSALRSPLVVIRLTLVD